jgi:N utilization substance protein B
VRERSRARAWAVQVLYAWEMRAPGATPLDVLGDFSRERRIAPASRGYLERILRIVAEHKDTIDAALQAALTNWRLDRLAAIDRNILRVAAAEILYVDEVPSPVSIQEAIVLAEKYGTVDSPRFVNGVLDALMRQHRPHERRPRDGGRS